MQTVLILTSRCNAACTHCTSSCGPQRTESLTRADVFRLMDESAAIDDGKPLLFDLTGGEPFLDFDLLLAVVEYGSSLGAQLSCVTNGYWATSDEVAATKLTALKRAGLSHLSGSVSRFHQAYVPLKRVRRALTIASELGLKTELKGAVTPRDLESGAAFEDWKAQLTADVINIFPLYSKLREGASLPDQDYWREAGLPSQPCPGPVVCIEPDGRACSCAGPSFSFVTLGNVHETSLDEIHRRFKQAGKQTILREHGPIHFAAGAIAAGEGHRLRDAYAGPCDLCVHIGTDPQLRAVAERMSRQRQLSQEALVDSARHPTTLSPTHATGVSL